MLTFNSYYVILVIVVGILLFLEVRILITAIDQSHKAMKEKLREFEDLNGEFNELISDFKQGTEKASLVEMLNLIQEFTQHLETLQSDYKQSYSTLYKHMMVAEYEYDVLVSTYYETKEKLHKERK